MKVLVDVGAEPVTQLEMRLKSTNMRFIHHLYPSHLEYPKNIDSIALEGRDNHAVIEFMDTREIDVLIQMLERFKRDNSYHFDWR